MFCLLSFPQHSHLTDEFIYYSITEHSLAYCSSKMPKDCRASESVPVLATAPSCDILSGVPGPMWSHSEHGHGKAVITG